MQREQISFPKMILYVLFAVLFYVLQSSVIGTWSIRGFHLDLLPCIVAAAALCDGPMEGGVMGVVVGVLYDVGFVGMDGVYPIFFLLFGLVAGALSRLALSRNYVSMMLTSAAEMVILGLLRYFCYLLPMHGASFTLVLQQMAGGTLLSCALCFLVYAPMSKISRIFDTR